MRISKIKKTSVFLLSVGIFLISSQSQARLGEGPQIKDLIAHSDVVCAGRIANYESVTVAGQNGGSNSTWIAANFAVDHSIKGSIPSNNLVILVNRLEHPEKAKDVLAQLGTGVNTSRFLVFLKTQDVNVSQFNLVDTMNGILLISPNAPLVAQNAGIEERVEAEIIQGLKQLGPTQREQIQTMAEKWQKERQAITNK